ncbi:MAG: winged helix-turn-helix domain-containing protein [Candidatus Aenigmatarchaeota archaeon]
MAKVALRVLDPVDENAEMQVMLEFLPEIRVICNNKIRAGILHLLINSPESLHAMQVEELCFKLGIKPSVCIHHLEKLADWKLVEVRKSRKYGEKSRRSIWGLNLKYPNWILECYKNIRNYFFTEKELEEITSKNKAFRNFKSL